MPVALRRHRELKRSAFTSAHFPLSISHSPPPTSHYPLPTHPVSLRERLSQDMKDALRAKETVRLGAIRMLSAALLEKEKEGRGIPSEADEVAIVQRQAKQRRDSISQFRAAGREDLAATEEAELEVIERYLPAQLSDDEIAGVVAEVVAGAGATGPAAMGRVMGEAMKRLRGKADGDRVRAAVERAINS